MKLSEYLDSIGLLEYYNMLKNNWARWHLNNGSGIIQNMLADIKYRSVSQLLLYITYILKKDTFDLQCIIDESNFSLNVTKKLTLYRSGGGLYNAQRTQKARFLSFTPSKPQAFKFYEKNRTDWKNQRDHEQGKWSIMIELAIKDISLYGPFYEEEVIILPSAIGQEKPKQITWDESKDGQHPEYKEIG